MTPIDTLAESASGLRHLRWAREVLATLEAHYELNPKLEQAQRDAVLEEVVKLQASITALSAAVKAYRDFLERGRVGPRGMQRVGRFLCDGARRVAAVALPVAPNAVTEPEPPRGLAEGHARAVALANALADELRASTRALAALGELEEAAGVLEGFNEAFANVETRQRQPLKAALDRAKRATRAQLRFLDARLAAAVSPAFVASLYPELTPSRQAVLDEGDDDDDAAFRR